jgi:small-conductance mechanosensitive channel
MDENAVVDVYDITETIKNRFDAEGIGIPFPQREIHIVRGEAAE